ncbi:Methionine S-methyltransferase [Nymphaea thermarum]|nr:Methionine S-methyltransferase [Nymphaea thermarum]
MGWALKTSRLEEVMSSILACCKLVEILLNPEAKTDNSYSADSIASNIFWFLPNHQSKLLNVTRIWITSPIHGVREQSPSNTVTQEHKNDSIAMIGFTKSAITAFNDVELFVNRTKDTQLIHMDVDHSSLPIPLAIKGAIFESFARQNMTEQETDVGEEIQLFINENYGFVMHNASEFVYGDCPLALFNKLILCVLKKVEPSVFLLAAMETICLQQSL